MSASATERPSRHLPAAHWADGAFGLALTGDLAVTGLGRLAPGEAPPGAPAVTLRAATRAQLDARWPGAGAERISAVRDDRGRAALTIDRHPDAGHLLTGVGYGRFHVGPGAASVTCAPVRVPAWRWQRYLLGQALPFVAGLRGRELLHAGAVVADGSALAVTGPSGAGKTTLLAHLLAAGATFLADDTVALEAVADGVLAHPGPGIAVLRPDAAAALPAPLGPTVGASGDEVCVAVGGETRPVRLGAIAFLERGGAGRLPVVEPLPAGDPRPLLGAAYDAVRRDPARLLAQLDLLAHVAASVRLLRLRLPDGTSPAAAAAALTGAWGR